MKLSGNFQKSKCPSITVGVLGLSFFWFAVGMVWATEPVRINEKSAPIDDACVKSAFDSLTAGFADKSDGSSELRATFYSALALQQCAMEIDGPQKESMLNQAVLLYKNYLETRPNDSGVANNLAKIFQQLGRFEEATDYYELAIAKQSKHKRMYLQDYAEYLDDSGEWQRASEIYSKLMQEFPLSQSQQEILAARYAERGLNELAGFLWELISQGGSGQTAEIALKHLAVSTDNSIEPQIEILTIITVALSRLSFDPVWYEESIRGGLKALDSVNKPAIALGARELIKLQDVAVSILSGLGAAEPLDGDVCVVEDQHQQLKPQEYRWWSEVPGDIDRDPVRGVWPADGFRVLAQTLGAHMRQVAGDFSEPDMRSYEYLRFAESYFELAAKLRPDNIDPSAVLELVDMKFETDQLLEVENVRKEYGSLIENENRKTTSEIQLKKSFSYHGAVGGMYSKIGVEDNPDTAKIVVDQLELAQDINTKLDDSASEKLPWSYQFTPGMIDMLAEGYSDTDEPEKIVNLRINQAKRYKEAGDFCIALQILSPLKYSDAAIQLYQSLLQELSDKCSEERVPDSDSDSDSDSHSGSHPDPGPQPDPPVDSNYIGDDIRLSIGYTSETDLTGEFLWNFLEDADSAYSLEGWKGDDKSGGAKLNFHWLAGKGKASHPDGIVRKLFIAADQNAFADGKVTFGGGSELEDHFWSLYASKSTTGKRALGQTVDIEQLFEQGMVDNHTFFQTDTLTTTTDFFARPYDWGVGFRIGRFYEDNLIRLRGGFDYEDGDFSSYQLTGYVSADKRFKNSKQGLSVRAEIVRKNGDLETDKNDLRFSAFWSWDFGQSFRSVPVVSATQPGQPAYASQPPVAQSTVNDAEPSGSINAPREAAVESIERQITLKGAGFELDCDRLTPEAKNALAEFVESANDPNRKIVGDISVIGHTCSLGTEEYNQILSEDRAVAVATFLNEMGFGAGIQKIEGRGDTKRKCPEVPSQALPRDGAGAVAISPNETDFGVAVLKIEGRGENEPKYSNCSEATRAKNRRVEIKYTVEQKAKPDDRDEREKKTAIAHGEKDPPEDIKSLVTTEPAWIRRALRNPVSHKRTVDYYRYSSVSQNLETEREVINEGPVADNDEYTVQQDSTNNPLNILANDSDPEYDNLKIVAVSNPAHGAVTISGTTVLYTPNPGFYGLDSFTYEIEDIFVTEPHPPGPASTAHVSINVMPANEPPVAVDDAYEVGKNSSDNRFDVLVNDSDPEGDVLTIIGTGTPTNGTVTFTGDSILYTPNEGYVGEDRFDYTITDGKGGEATAWVTVSIKTRPPVAVNDRGQTWKNTSVVIDVLANDYDPDGDPITIVEIIQDEHPMGTVVDNGDGTLTYTPMRGWWGGDKFQYTISDGEQTATATVTLKVINNIWD